MFQITASTLVGVEALPVFVETDISSGLPTFRIVGLPDVSVKESRDRIRAAIKNTQLRFPRGRVTVNLAPAHIRKQGSLYDVPIAVSIMAASGSLSYANQKDILMIGELALDGSVRPVQGVLNTAILAKKLGKTQLFVPIQNIEEALCVKEITVFGISSLRALVDHLIGRSMLEPATSSASTTERIYETDFAHIKGQPSAKRALEIAASGGHNILLKGPPGTGKTLLARALPSILPDLTEEEAIEVTSIASISSEIHSSVGLIRKRPFRAPHHSASAIALVGGGSWPKPGEVTLAHRGVLFLDELPEFSRYVLEHLRQPLEDGYVIISRAISSVTFPARFLLAAAMNPCPCGFATDPRQECTCSQAQLHAYHKRLSGPLLDRFDCIIEVPNLETQQLMAQEASESSELVRTRVQKARDRQTERYQTLPLFLNSEISSSLLESTCQMTDETRELLRLAIEHKHLSARGYSRVRKVARTIADLAETELIEFEQMAEALQFRSPLLQS